MAGSVNKVILVGNLGRDPEVRHTQQGGLIVNMSIATSENWRDKASGERKERTEWHRVVIFNEKLAEVAQKYLRKGAKVYVEGQLATRKWTDQSGQERYTTEIEANEMQMLGGRQSSDSAPSEKPQRNAQGAPKQSFEDDGEIPFTPHGAGRAWRVI